MNKRNFLKKTFKITGFFSLLLFPLNIIFPSNNLKVKKIFKKHQNRIWILKSDDI